MVVVSEMDQDALRFLWFRNVQGQEPEVQAYKFTRVVFGVGPSPYLLNATIMHHLELFEDKYSVTVSKLNKSMYVDDVVMGTDTLSEAISTCIEARDIFAKGGFNLRKFLSNSRKLQNIF